jgi:hypothetical protein
LSIRKFTLGKCGSPDLFDPFAWEMALRCVVPKFLSRCVQRLCGAKRGRNVRGSDQRDVVCEVNALNSRIAGAPLAVEWISRRTLEVEMGKTGMNLCKPIGL